MVARGGLLDELVRPVGRAVRGDDDLEALARVVEREQVLEPPRDDRLLVVRRDDERDRRLDLPPRDRPRAEPREQPHRRRVPRVRPRERPQRAPEERLRDHGGQG